MTRPDTTTAVKSAKKRKYQPLRLPKPSEWYRMIVAGQVVKK